MYETGRECSDNQRPARYLGEAFLQRKENTSSLPERSGTHFLINSIASNFPYSNNVLSLLGDPHNLKEVFSAYSKREEHRIFKTHHQAAYFSSFWNVMTENFTIFYIVRDGRDVINSCFHYFNRAGSKSFPVTRSISELLKISPSSYDFDKEYSLDISNNMIERWVKHVKGWTEKEGIHIIRYESLNMDFENTIEEINKILQSRRGSKRPPLSGVCPRKGVVDDWKNYFSAKDTELYEKIAGEFCKGIGY